MPNNFERRLKKIVERDGRYSTFAYRFIYEGLDYTLKRISCKRHVTGRELAEGLRDLAIEQFGGLARMVLEMWGIRSTSDFGNMVFNLIDSGLMSQSESDNREDFDGVYTFDKVFRFDAVVRTGRRSKRG